MAVTCPQLGSVAHPDGISRRFTAFDRPDSQGAARASNVARMARPVRAYDLSLAATFECSTFGPAIADRPVAFGVEISPTSPNPFARTVYAYATGCDPITLHAPAFIRVIALLSAFLFIPFYPVLAYAIARQCNRIRVPALVYAAMITATDSMYFGVAPFGEPEWRCQDLPKFLGSTLPYLIAPWLLAFRMCKSIPFASAG